MDLAAFFTAASIGLDLEATRREEVLDRMVALLGVTGRQRATLLRLLARREVLGSTGVGRGIAIPHCRSLVVQRVRMAYGRLRTPLPWDAPDGQPIRHVFLIVAPPVEVSNQFLPALGRLARVAREGASVAALERATSTAEVLTALGALGG